jgi:hypothetical protein
MPIIALFLTTVLFVAAAWTSAAVAQGAATGGTKDQGSPTMVFPVRPRDEPPAVTAVPNRSHRIHSPAGRSVLIYRYRNRRR